MRETVTSSIPSRFPCLMRIMNDAFNSFIIVLRRRGLHGFWTRSDSFIWCGLASRSLVSATLHVADPWELFHPCQSLPCFYAIEGIN